MAAAPARARPRLGRAQPLWPSSPRGCGRALPPALSGSRWTGSGPAHASARRACRGAAGPTRGAFARYRSSCARISRHPCDRPPGTPAPRALWKSPAICSSVMVLDPDRRAAASPRPGTTGSPGRATGTAPSSPASRAGSSPRPAGGRRPCAGASARRRRGAGSAWAAGVVRRVNQRILRRRVTRDTLPVKRYIRRTA